MLIFIWYQSWFGLDPLKGVAWMSVIPMLVGVNGPWLFVPKTSRVWFFCVEANYYKALWIRIGAVYGGLTKCLLVACLVIDHDQQA